MFTGFLLERGWKSELHGEGVGRRGKTSGQELTETCVQQRGQGRACTGKGCQGWGTRVGFGETGGRTHRMWAELGWGEGGSGLGDSRFLIWLPG